MSKSIKSIVIPVFLWLCIGFLSNPSATMVTIDCKNVICTLNDHFHGMNCVGNSQWDSKLFSTGSANALRRAGVKILRWPGGNPAESYDWSVAGSCPKAADFVPYAQAIGARILFQTDPVLNTYDVNNTLPTDTSAKYAAQWVSWCESNNVDAPLWEIGNEPEWSGQSLADYMVTFNRQAPAMKAQNANITIMGPSTTNIAGYTPIFIDSCGKNADAISVHFYIGGALTDMLTYGQTVPMNYMKLLKKYNKPVYITEWSCMTASVPPTGSPYYGLALGTINMIGGIAKSGYAGHTFFGEVHHGDAGWGVLYDDDHPNPTYFALPLWTEMGNMVLSASYSADSVDTFAVWAHKKVDGSVQVMFINKTPHARTDTVSLGCDLTGKEVDIYELRPSNISLGATSEYYNGVLAPTPATTDLPPPTKDTASGMTYSHYSPPFAVTIMDFHVPPVSVQRPVRHSTNNPISATLMAGNGFRNGAALLIESPSRPKVNIFTGAGKSIANAAGLIEAGDDRYRLDVSDFPAGAYIASISSSGKNVNRVFTITK